MARPRAQRHRGAGRAVPPGPADLARARSLAHHDAPAAPRRAGPQSRLHDGRVRCLGGPPRRGRAPLHHARRSLLRRAIAATGGPADRGRVERLGRGGFPGPGASPQPRPVAPRFSHRHHPERRSAGAGHAVHAARGVEPGKRRSAGAGRRQPVPGQGSRLPPGGVGRARRALSAPARGDRRPRRRARTRTPNTPP